MPRLGARLLVTRLRQSRASALLVIVVLAAAGAAGTSAVLLRSAVTGPWDRAFTATHGAHVRVSSFGDVDTAALAALPGVTETSGPVVSTIRALRHEGRTTGVALAAVAEGLRVDRPAVVEGAWRSGAVILERSFARALGVDVGERVDVQGSSGWLAFDVSGLAVSVRNAGYPSTVPGSAFTDVATAASLGTDGQRLTTVGLRVADPAAEAATARAASRYGSVTTASSVRAEALDRTRQFQVVLASFSVVLVAASVGLVVVVLGARLRAQRRELLMLRLIGLTPGQIIGLVAAEHAVLGALGGLVGTAVALAGGARVAAAAATALGSTSPELGLPALAVTGGLVAVAGGVAALSTLRVARPGVAGPAAAAPIRPSPAAGRALAAGLPAPVALVAREISSSRARAVSTVLAMALAVMTSVAALGMEATFRHDRQEAAARSVAGDPPPGMQPIIGDPDAGRDESGLRTLVYGLQALLASVALASVVAVGLVGLRERRRELAVLSAIGFSVRQLAGSTVAGQGVLAGLGALAGIPLGIGFFRLAYALANGSSAGLVDAPALHLLAVVPVAMLVAGIVAALPASGLRRVPLAAALAPA